MIDEHNTDDTAILEPIGTACADELAFDAAGEYVPAVDDSGWGDADAFADETTMTISEEK